jgi:hypothetical protein
MKNNKLIAEFMGANPFREYVNEDIFSYELYGIIEVIDDGEHEKHFFLPEEMLFNEYWDWLMPAVKKCLILTCDNDWHEWDLSIAETLRSVHIKTVYEEVVEFIKFYNSLTHS